MSSLNEASLKTIIEAHLFANGYVSVPREGFDRERRFSGEGARVHPRDTARGMGEAGGAAWCQHG